VAHGATGKGNDQVRFELTYYALKPDVTVIAPWREWDLTSRTRLIEFAEQHQIPIAKDKRGEAPVLGRRQSSARLVRRQSAGRPERGSAGLCYSRTDDPGKGARPAAGDHGRFREGRRRRGRRQEAVTGGIAQTLNDLGRHHGIGRLDLVENRFVGMKSRGMYETPGGTILLAAHRGIESITLDRGAAHLKDELMPKYAELIYNGFWFTPEREMLQSAIDKSQEFVSGRVTLKLFKGSGRGDRAREQIFALRSGACDLRGGSGGLRPSRRRRLHQAQRAAASHARAAQAQAQTLRVRAKR
jgi:argininosuccinate synthase